MSEETLPDTKGQITQKLEDVAIFFKSAIFRQYIKTVSKDIDLVKEKILHTAPLNTESVLSQAQDYGRLDVLQQQLTIFEEYRDNLERALVNLD